MARAGVYFSDVKRARDALISRNRHPSIDAIRAELGNTGSKTTIHKYLREMQTDEESVGRSVSDAIGALVEQLAEQLRTEADATVTKLRDENERQQTQHELELIKLTTDLARANGVCDATAAKLEDVQRQLDEIRQQLSDEKIARSAAEQRNSALAERLSDADRHQASLEDKHKQAREGLEHFRTAAREQREQETRRHEHQVQSIQTELQQTRQAAALKQEELTRLNREAAGLSAEVAAVKQALYREQQNGHNLARRVEQLKLVELQVVAIRQQAEESRTLVESTQAELAAATDCCSELRQQKVILETELTAARAMNTLDSRISELQRAVFGQPDSSAKA